MRADIFFSICQTVVDGFMPDERQMFQNFFSQVELADRLGFGTAWVAETHLSCEVQKGNPGAVIPHFQGEIGLNTDILQLAARVFARTDSIMVGSAIRNIICNGGPLAHAEAVKTFLTLHGLDPAEKRRLHLGFAAGRFPFSNIPYGYVPRNAMEEVAWPVVKGRIFREATTIFLRALRGDRFSSADLPEQVLVEEDFRTAEHWQEARAAWLREHPDQDAAGAIPLAPRWEFPTVGVIPVESPLDLLELVIGSHDPQVQILANSILPCGVFNLSITPSATIEETHQRMEKAFHPDGGGWQRSRMPRTALIFLNGDEALSMEQRSAAATAAARSALSNYWRAMEGTLDEDKVNAAVHNALVGNSMEVVRQIREKYHPGDRLMLWFDFNNHDNPAICRSMECFSREVLPQLQVEEKGDG